MREIKEKKFDKEIILTDEEIRKERIINMNVDEKIKVVLEEIHSGIFNAERTLRQISREELKNIILMCEEEGYLSHRNSKGKLVQQFMGGGFDVTPTVFVTRSGVQFLEGFDRNMPQPSQSFNIGTAYGSAFGNHSSVTNNYSNTPVEDLKDYVNSLTGEDKVMGEELVDTLEKDDVRPGFLSKFEGFISKYPKTIDLIASALTSVAVSGFTS